MIAIAREIHWTLEEVEQYFIEVEEISSDDGHPYFHLATFSEETPVELKNRAGLNSSNQLHLKLDLMPSGDVEEDI